MSDSLHTSDPIVLTRSAYSLLRHIREICKRNDVTGIDNNIFGAPTAIAPPSSFNETTITGIIDKNLAAFRSPAQILPEFRDAVIELENKKCICIEGETWKNWFLGKSMLGYFRRAINEFSAKCGADPDLHLDFHLREFINENYRELADAKVGITNRGINFTFRRSANSLDPTLGRQSREPV